MLPLAKSDIAKREAKGRVLIVDDVADNRDLLARRLRSRNFETVEAAGGLEALRHISNSRFDAVLLDVMMPDISGLEVLRQVRMQHSASALPIIMVTANNEAEDIVRALESGANDYITKPINFAVVFARVTTQIGRRHAAIALEMSKAALEEQNMRLLQANARLQDEIARRHDADRKSHFLAYHDSLTGLANRHAFDERMSDLMSGARAAGKGLAVLFVDLDGFKDINDALGHPTGDALIKEVAVGMRGTVGHDDFLMRLGGDEFCVVHTSTEVKSTATALADRLIAVISETRVIEGNEVYVGASIGIAVADATVETGSELLKRADMAMYRSKLEGRGTWRTFKPEMAELQSRRHKLQLDLRNALQRAEFDLYFQPIVDLKTGRVTCFEALLRWTRHPGGPVPPDQFIPLAEETGLIAPIGDWALRQACQEAARWPSDIRVAVNVSPVQFRDKHILTSLVSALASSGLAPERLELEITESVMLHKSDENVQILEDCRALGVRVALDDFGTGYSSLGYFNSFRFDKIKIDRSFISGPHNIHDNAVVRSVISLGESLGMTTTAEGVETEYELDYLRAEGCCEGQGYYFGRPSPASDVRQSLLREGVTLSVNLVADHVLADEARHEAAPAATRTDGADVDEIGRVGPEVSMYSGHGV